MLANILDTMQTIKNVEKEKLPTKTKIASKNEVEIDFQKYESETLLLGVLKTILHNSCLQKIVIETWV